MPGPGQYSLRDDWQVLQQKAAYRNRQPPQKRGQGGRGGGAAPSIPAHDQSFGYEETDDGELRMQRPPDGGYTGVSGHRSAGPGEYDPTKATSLTKRAGVMPDFGNSRVPRSLFSESRDVPGPGLGIERMDAHKPRAEQWWGEYVGVAVGPDGSRRPQQHERS